MSRGAGRVIRHPCMACKGFGRVEVSKKIKAHIPPGVASGNRLRIKGEGEAGSNGGPPGDLYIQIFVEPHEFFERDGEDVICRVPVSFPQAALGSELEVPTLEGSETVTIARGTQPGGIIRLRSKGIPHLRGMGRGDQIIIVDVHTPTSLTPRQEELLHELAELEGEKVNEKHHYWNLFGRFGKKQKD